MLLKCPETTAKYYPPRKFTGADGCSFVSFCDTPQFAADGGKATGSRGRGLRYEQRVGDMLDHKLEGTNWVPVRGPWLEYVARDGRVRYAQPDILVFNASEHLIIIVEIKLSRVPEAWWQLNRKYAPLVRALFPKWQLGMLEIAAQMYAVAVPEQVNVVHRVDQVSPNSTSFMQVPYD